ncbi:MAG: aminotransferase class V-fold PLP-dependent enzyme [Woeseiaceae bacterium]|nr:aminotransferase class V-fold PLP-dependent enzyme [Woeseiaceae bacterium]
MVYLDYAATTPADPAAVAMLAELAGSGTGFANASSAHVAGRRAARHVETAAAQVAGLLGCDPGRLVWTSGATEADNLAILGAARARAGDGRHLVTMPTEHKAVTDTFRALEQEGFEVTWLAPKADGRLDLDRLAAAIRDDTQLVSIMHVNNETGVVQNIAGIGALCRERGVLYHVDAAQSAGKLPLDLDRLPVDLLSVSAHKLYGPKGIGVLCLGAGIGSPVLPLFFGGSQQRGLRPGTLPVPLIAAFGAAAATARASLAADLAHVTAMRDRLLAGLEGLPGLRVNGSLEHGYPGIVNVSAAGVEGESLLLALEPVCVAAGSACNAKDREPSAVLRALGLDDREAGSAIRFSFGRPTTAAEVDFAAKRYRAAVERLRGMAPGQAA